MSWGGKREGSGRKGLADEMGLPMLIEEVIGESGKKELIAKIYSKAQTGSFLHQQLLMHYIFGKPKESINLNGKLDGSITIKWEEPNVSNT